MHIKRHIIFLLTAVILANACRSSRQVVSSSAGEASAAAYITKYKDLAISEMKRTGVPASITLAQGMIESSYGRSTLAVEGNNHFGIKCHNGWTGATIRHHDDRRNECFRKYRRPEDSFYDHSDFLRSGSRYSFLFNLPVTDYKSWARGLKKAGYATDPDYANMLIRKIEENKLYAFDKLLITPGQNTSETAVSQPVNAVPAGVEPKNEKPPVDFGDISLSSRTPRIMENNRIQYIIVRDGETVESLEEDFELLRWELTRYNELENDFIPEPGQILYLQPKRDRAEPGKETHTAREGETMYQISQKYGVKVKKLYEYNLMNEGDNPVAGQKIWLRTIKTVK